METNGNPFSNGGVFESSQVGAEYVVWILLGLAALIGLVIYASYRYKRYKSMQEFSDEMHQVGLSTEEESTLTDLVKHYAMQEPVQILLSLRMFDEMACQEISRVLGSSGSTTAKDRFVQMIYDIRKKTYFPDWDKKEEQLDGNEEKNKSHEPPNGINGESPVMT